MILLGNYEHTHKKPFMVTLGGIIIFYAVLTRIKLQMIRKLNYQRIKCIHLAI